MSGITFQLTIIIGGVLTILIGLVLSDLIIGGVAGASTYETNIGRTGLNPASPSDVYEDCYLLQVATEPDPDPDSDTGIRVIPVPGFNAMGTPTPVDNAVGDAVTSDVLVAVNNPAVECGLSNFTGSTAVLFLVPIVYYLFILAIGLGMIGVGALGVTGRGPSGGR